MEADEGEEGRDGALGPEDVYEGDGGLLLRLVGGGGWGHYDREERVLWW